MQHGKKMHVAQMPPLTLVASGKCLVSAFYYRWSSSVAALCVCTQRLLQLLVKCSMGPRGLWFPIFGKTTQDKFAFNELTIKVCVCCS